jgi:hypothetical protein
LCYFGNNLLFLLQILEIISGGRPDLMKKIMKNEMIRGHVLAAICRPHCCLLAPLPARLPLPSRPRGMLIDASMMRWWWLEEV